MNLIKPDARQVERDWKQRGFSFGIFRDPPGRSWEGYVHGEDELFMVEEGLVELEVGNKTFMAGVGQEILIPAGVAHSVRNKGKKDSYWYYGYKV